jgi:hypothetical protein
MPHWAADRLFYYNVPSDHARIFACVGALDFWPFIESVDNLFGFTGSGYARDFAGVCDAYPSTADSGGCGGGAGGGLSRYSKYMAHSETWQLTAGKRARERHGEIERNNRQSEMLATGNLFFVLRYRNSFEHIRIRNRASASAMPCFENKRNWFWVRLPRQKKALSSCAHFPYSICFASAMIEVTGN